MAKAVFITKVTPSYDDLPEERYHFPRTYLNFVEQTVGDQIVYYEPRRSTSDLSSRGGRQAYFAIAVVTGIEPDPADSDKFYARVTGYISFNSVVPWRRTAGSYEAALLKEDGSANKGQHGRAVRILPDHEFEAICQAGFGADPWDRVQVRAASTIGHRGLQEEADDFVRPMVEQTLLRPVRDKLFSRSVRLAYENKCAFTGLKITNGGGRPEVQAAHIQPVSDRGPDSTRNGLALSGTLHWAFDRGLISIDDDYKLLVAGGSIPDPLKQLLNPSGEISLPEQMADWPHPKFLRYHREHVFKG